MCDLQYDLCESVIKTQYFEEKKYRVEIVDGYFCGKCIES